jgi:hypothetical protein
MPGVLRLRREDKIPYSFQVQPVLFFFGLRLLKGQRSNHHGMGNP